jgi:tRNA (guanine26-N2/guanine27-N2)-dimethyltransferase
LTEKGEILEEEGISFIVPKGIFYNPNMRFCRSMSSLAVGAIPLDLEVVDAFTASGIRGIRYAKENRNVKKITFLDIEKSAISAAKKNSKSNKLKKSAAIAGNISRMAFELDADFLEIDPFGTPSPYLVDAFRFFNTKKSAYLSVTATDVAVLCGAKTSACLKNYHSKPMNNEFTHETGLRILLKKIAETAAEFNMGIEPLVSFSDRHYLKAVVLAKRSADLAADCMKKLGHVSYCKTCGWRGSARFPVPCSVCGAETDYAGPLWLGELHRKDFLEKMRELNRIRHYADKEEIARALGLMEGETAMPPFYYDVHALCRVHHTGEVPPMQYVIETLAASGARVYRTHFSPVGIKTDAPYPQIVEAIKWKR